MADVSVWHPGKMSHGGIGQSKESHFTTGADSTAGHLSLFPLVFSCCAAFWLENSTEFPPLHGFWQSGHGVHTLLHTVFKAPLDCVVCGRSGVLTTFHPGTSHYIFLCNFCTVIFHFIFPCNFCTVTSQSQSSFHKCSAAVTGLFWPQPNNMLPDDSQAWLES